MKRLLTKPLTILRSRKPRLTTREADIQARVPLVDAARGMFKGDPGPKGPWIGQQYHYRSPLPVRKLLTGETDFCGLRLDRMVFVGPLAEVVKGKGQRWLVKCDCGIYETRKLNAMKGVYENGKLLGGKLRTDRQACSSCLHTQYLQRLDYFNRHGRWQPDTPVYIAELWRTLPVAD